MGPTDELREDLRAEKHSIIYDELETTQLIHETDGAKRSAYKRAAESRSKGVVDERCSGWMPRMFVS